MYSIFHFILRIHNIDQYLFFLYTSPWRTSTRSLNTIRSSRNQVELLILEVSPNSRAHKIIRIPLPPYREEAHNSQGDHYPPIATNRLTHYAAIYYFAACVFWEERNLQSHFRRCISGRSFSMPQRLKKRLVRAAQ